MNRLRRAVVVAGAGPALLLAAQPAAAAPTDTVLPIPLAGAGISPPGLPNVCAGFLIVSTAPATPDVVDLPDVRGALYARERDSPAGVGVVQRAGEDGAVVRSGLDRDGDQAPAQDVVAGIAAVVPARDGDIVGPCMPEQRPIEPGFGVRPLTGIASNVAAAAGNVASSSLTLSRGGRRKRGLRRRAGGGARGRRRTGSRIRLSVSVFAPVSDSTTVAAAVPAIDTVRARQEVDWHRWGEVLEWGLWHASGETCSVKGVVGEVATRRNGRVRP